MTEHELKIIIDGHEARSRYVATHLRDLPQIYADQMPIDTDAQILEAAATKIRQQIAADRKQFQNPTAESDQQVVKDKPFSNLTPGQSAYAASIKLPDPVSNARPGNGLTSGQAAYAQTNKLPFSSPPSAAKTFVGAFEVVPGL